MRRVFGNGGWVLTERKTPAGLAPKSARLWRAIAGPGRWGLRPDELRVLEDACREADLVDELG
jgi:hypothetical protein